MTDLLLPVDSVHHYLCWLCSEVVVVVEVEVEVEVAVEVVVVAVVEAVVALPVGLVLAEPEQSVDFAVNYY